MLSKDWKKEANTQIRFILSRTHCFTTNKEVLRNFYNRIKNLNLSKEERKYIYKKALEVHKENRDLYYFVMR